MADRDDKEYKPYTTPYTGAGAVKTEQGWVNSRDLGAPGVSSGPGKRRDSGPIYPFHHAEVTSTNVPPPPGHENIEDTGRGSGRSSMSSAKRTSRAGSFQKTTDSKELEAIKGPGGVGFDLPQHHPDLSKLSSKDIGLKIGLLHIKKGNVHEAMHQAATSREILSLEPHEQLKLREENEDQLRAVEEAIRAWEKVQSDRAKDIPSPSLVDMLMLSQDYCQDQNPRGRRGSRTPEEGSSSSERGNESMDSSKQAGWGPSGSHTLT
ncbi:hypothetical protein F5Y17DRAFT_326837 [Xylariaceae sp. FL0594]|nr:hypothetical protein F5Y17DRAFT_326837 [Xylariaceae sp. FL0594]